MQNVEGFQQGSDFLADKSLRLGTLCIEPGSEVAMLGVLYNQAVARACHLERDESVEYPERSRVSFKKLSEVSLAEPTRDPGANLDADPRRERSGGGRRPPGDLARTPFSDQPVQTGSPACLIAVEGGNGRS